MIQTIRVTTKIGPDVKGNGVLHDIKTLLKRSDITDVKTTRVYRIEGVSEKDATVLAEKLFAEPINQSYSINKPLLQTKLIKEIGYKPGVMNPEAASILKAAHDLGIHPTAADSSTEYAFYGRVSTKELDAIIHGINLFNKTVEHIVQKQPKTLLLTGKPGKTEIIKIREMTNEKLMQLSKDKLFLNLEEMIVIQKYFQKIKRDPTDLEIETLAQTWSEHSGHKTFKAKLTVDGKKKEPLFTRIKKAALKHDKHIVSAFGDNSGVMDFYDGYGISGKGETHNSPSAIEPYGGAMTGSGGVFRDIVGTGLGGKTLVSTDIFCLAPYDMDLKKLPPGCLYPDYILRRVVAAVKDYGNRMGIPTNNGSFHFHEDFRAKPTVLVGAYGIQPKNKAQIGIPQKGDLIIIVGGRTGRDGIHGATFSSGEMTHDTIAVNAQAVQIGNAVEEKRTFDAILEARDQDCIRAIQDVGGGGFSSAIGEMGKDTGVTVQLKNAKLKYSGLSPWEIWMSESQERMMIGVPKNKLQTFKNICKKYNVELQELGIFDGSRKLQIFYGKEKVGDLSMDFLHDGLPQREMTAKKPLRKSPQKPKLPNIPKLESQWITMLEKVLSHGNVNSKEPIVRLYDHNVQGTNALSPFSGEPMEGPNDAAVIKPLLHKPYGMVVSHGLNPILNRIDPYMGSLWAATEAMANYVAVGGNYHESSLINNYIWPFPDEEALWSLDTSVDAVVDFMNALQIPVISGKDSLSSTYRGKDGLVIKIPPVLCISAFGRIPDVSKTQSSDLKKSGSTLVLVGQPDFASMGGSIYYQASYPKLAEESPVPAIDLKLLPKVFSAITNGVQSGKILASHDISEGGLITALFEMAVGGDMGIAIDSSKLGKERTDFILFNETAGTFVVEVANEQTAKKLFAKVPHMIIGKTIPQKSITVQTAPTKTLFKADIELLKKSWQEPMKQFFS